MVRSMPEYNDIPTPLPSCADHSPCPLYARLVQTTDRCNMVASHFDSTEQIQRRMSASVSLVSQLRSHNPVPAQYTDRIVVALHYISSSAISVRARGFSELDSTSYLLFTATKLA